MKQFPSQIRRDLHRYHNLKIGDWWRGTTDGDGNLIVSSSELLDYLEYLDDESAFKTDAERGGRWSDWKTMLAEVVNEAYRMRSSYFVVNGGADARWDPTEFEFIDPVVRKYRDEIAETDAKVAAESYARFESEIGFNA